MKSFTAVALFVGVMIAFAYAQHTAMEAQIPYSFSVGKATLPAGRYRFYTEDSGKRLIIRSDKDAQSVQVITSLGGPTKLFDTSLVFDKQGDSRTLSEVWLPGSAGLLVHRTADGHEHELLSVALSSSAKQPPKAIFEQTCQRCHGAGGKGNPDADKFFKLTIPRLNSDYVQSKSDSEIKEVIMNGRRQMDPVRIGEQTGGTRHMLLQPEAIDAVIGYVRSFKEKN